MTKDEKIRKIEEQIEALTVAVPKEDAAHRFYMDLAEGASHKGAKEMYLKLAEQELHHKHDLEKLIDTLKGQIEKLRQGEEDDGLWDLT